MNKLNTLKNTIKDILKEYTGTGASGGNSTDGNDIPSQRINFTDAQDEMDFYDGLNVYGAEGGHRTGDLYTGNYPNRMRFPFMESKHYGKYKSLERAEKNNDVVFLEMVYQMLDKSDNPNEEIKKIEQAFGYATLTTQGEKARRGIGVMEQVSQAAQKSYERGLKKLQKQVLRFQLRWIERQRAAALSQAATASTQQSKGFDDQIKGILDQIKNIDNPGQAGGKSPQKENIIRQYFKERKNINLMEIMDSYKKVSLMEGTIKRLFDSFKKGESNEDITSYYAKKGIKIPEQFLSKVRKQYESLEKLKLELDFSEQESKDVVTLPAKTPNVNLENEVEEKQLSSRLENIKETKKKVKEETKRYPIPPEIEDTLVDKLKMNPLIRYVDSLKAVSSIPPSYEVRLVNGQDFHIYYQDDGLMAKIGPEEYYIDHYQEVNYAIKHINQLLTQPAMRQDDADEEGEDSPKRPAGRKSPSKPPTGGAPKPPDLPDLPDLPPPPSPEDEA